MFELFWSVTGSLWSNDSGLRYTIPKIKAVTP